MNPLTSAITRLDDAIKDSIGSYDGAIPWEADENINFSARQVALEFFRIHTSVWGAKLNGDPEFQQLAWQDLCNHTIDFLVPVDDHELSTLVRCWKENGATGSKLQAIKRRVKKLGGVELYWT